MESDTTHTTTVSKPKHDRRTLFFQYLLAVFFVGGLEAVCLFDMRSLFWAALLLAVLRFHVALCRRLFAKQLLKFGVFAGLLFIWLPLHCVIWMFWLNPFEISKETTFVTEPLVSDGSRPDYFSALERHVTPKNPPEENGFRIMAEKLGSAIINCEPVSTDNDWRKNEKRKKWETICSKLRLDPETPKALMFQTLRLFLEEHETEINPPPDHVVEREAYWEWKKKHDETIIVLTPPHEQLWTEAKFPLAARWVAENDAVFDLLAEAVRKPVFFRPFAWDGEGDSLFHNLDLRSIVVHIAVAVRSRVLLRLGNSRVEDAWQDVLTLYRYTAHHRNDAFMRFDLDTKYMLAEWAARDVLRYGHFDTEQLRRYQTDLSAYRLPVPQELIDQIVFGERIYSLDEALTPIYLNTNSQPSNVNYLCRLLSWNHELVGLNKRYDAQIGRPLPVVYEKYVESKNSFIADLSYYLLWKGIFKTIPNLACQGKVRFCLCRPFPMHLDPRTRITQQRLTDLMFALTRYRLEQGEYPETLSNLSRIDGKIVLSDPFDESSSLKYEKNNPDGALLYSIGPNGVDDHGSDEHDLSLMLP